MHLCEKAKKNYRFKQPLVSSYFLHRLNADEQFVSSRKMITFIIFIHRCMCSVTCTSMARHLTVGKFLQFSPIFVLLTWHCLLEKGFLVFVVQS